MTKLLSAVDEALRAEDPEGLLELGAPADEYSDEARDIAVEVGYFDADKLTEENIAAVVCKVFVKAFGSVPEEAINKRLHIFRQIAKRIMTAVNFSDSSPML